MRTMSAVFVLVCLVGFSASAAAPGSQQPRTEGAPPTVDDVLKAVRADLQSSRADILSKNLTLTAEQAAKFWPLFDKYQKEQNVIMDEHMKAIQTFVNSFQSLDDAAALALMNGHFDRDTRMNSLRQRWLAEFQKVLPTKMVVRVMQIDRRLSLMQQIETAARIPLAH